MPVRLALAIATSLVLAGAFPHRAAADAYRQVLSVYEADGSIPPCQFSSPQLEAALRGEDAYGAQYFADFTDAIQSALGERASGVCTGRGRATARSHAGGAPLGVSGGSITIPASATSPTASPVPAVIVLLGVLALAGGTVAAMCRWGGSTVSRWAVSTRHAVAEAAFRVGGRLEQLVDLRRRSHSGPRRKWGRTESGPGG